MFLKGSVPSPEVKPVLRRALEMRWQIAREGWWNYARRLVIAASLSMFWIFVP